MTAFSKPVPEVEGGDGQFDFEAVFHAHYAHLARIVARVTGDPARAEELAVDALWKLWRCPAAQGADAGAGCIARRCGWA